VQVPVAKARRTLLEVLRDALGKLCRSASEHAGKARSGLGRAWAWCLRKIAEVAVWASGAGQSATAALSDLWRCRRSARAAAGGGVASGVGSYLAGPVAASLLCGLGGVALALSAMVLLPLWRLLAEEKSTA